MKRSSKILIATVAVVGITAGSLSMVSAGGRWGGDCHYGGPGAMQGYGPGMMGQQRMGFMRQGMHQDPAAHLERMKTLLQINKDQEHAWNEFTAAIQEKFDAKTTRFERMRKGEFSVQDRIGFMKERAEQMSEMATAMEKLYANLTPEQQKVVDTLGPMGRGMGGRGFGRHF